MSSERAFLGISALVFAISAGVTVVWCDAMSSMGGMPMPGGWTMSMAWMRMPGQSWPAAAGSFLGMWVVMMVAMMLPSLLPMLRSYRSSARASGLGAQTVVVGLGYFSVWTLVGVAVFPLGVAVAEIEMEQPAIAQAVPTATGAVVLLAGALQFTRWKARQLACCRRGPERPLPADPSTAWRHGLLLGLRCGRCCAGLMTIPVVVGVMDLRVMAIAGVAMAAERHARAGEHVARAIGAVAVVAGALLVARAAGLV